TPVKPMRSRVSSALAMRSIARAASPSSRRRDTFTACTASRTFSSTVKEAKRLTRWNERPMPRAVMRQVGSPATSRPMSAIRPAVGLISPDSMLTRVVLPAPFGPITACSSPWRNEMETSRTATSAPKVRVSRSVASTGGIAGRRSAMAADLSGRRMRVDAWADQAWAGDRTRAGRRSDGHPEDLPALHHRRALSEVVRQIARTGVGERADEATQGHGPSPAQDHQHRAVAPCACCELPQCGAGLTIPPNGRWATRWHRAREVATGRRARYQKPRDSQQDEPMPNTAPQTLYDKIFEDHVVSRLPDGTAILYIDRHL